MASISIEGLRELISPERIAQGTNLDKFFDDVFSKKLQFKVHQDFTRCLQATVENYVKDLLKGVMKLEEVQKKLKELEQSYEHNHDLFKETNEVLPVGSFYEDTKNSFPDEFDYVLILLSAQRLVNRSKSFGEISHFSDTFLRKITNVFANNVKDLTDYAIKVPENRYFDLTFKSFKRVGPACKLCFVLRKKIPAIFEGESIDIHVDITPAIRVHDKYLPFYVNSLCSVKGFRDEILKTGSFIVIQNESTRLSFTETEVVFMKSCLSSRHKKTYRILKYLVNGDNDEDKLREVNECFRLIEDYYTSYFKISSYALKLLIIHHHYSCRKDDSWTESACVVEVLKSLQDRVTICDKVINIPSLNPKKDLMICYGKDVVECFKRELSNLISMLMALSECNTYDFNEVAVVSVSTSVYTVLCTIKKNCQYAEKQKRMKRLCMKIVLAIIVLFCALLFAVGKLQR